eukprot:197692_1
MPPQTEYIMVDHEKDNNQQNVIKKNKKTILVDVDVESYNFQPSNNKYPTFKNVKKASSIPTYKPIKSPSKQTQIINTKSKKDKISKKKENQSTYPGFSAIKPISHLSTYTPSIPQPQNNENKKNIPSNTKPDNVNIDNINKN